MTTASLSSIAPGGRRRGRPTSWPFRPLQGFGGNGRSRFVGDVVLAAGVVAREAAEQGKTVENHAAHLVVHGVLHLLGYDHGGAMERLEVDALLSLGIGDPYAAEKVKGT